MFFVLDKLPKFATEVDIWIQTPSGNESVDFITMFFLEDGTLLAAWEHPFQKIPLHNVTVFCDGITQVLNLYPLERIIDIYDRPIDAELGTFTFTKSKSIGTGDWRCDRGMYGPQAFEEEQVSRVITDIGQVVVYEPFLSINSVGHMIYLESNAKSDLANEKINNSIAPLTGRTLQETLRLIYEWSLLCGEPFNSQDEPALAAKSFIEGFRFTNEELSILDSMPSMQISNYLSGSENARVRPNDIPVLNEAVKQMVFKRMASSSLSALLKIHNIDDVYNILQAEIEELVNGISRFREYYQIPSEWDMTEEQKIVEHCELYTKQGSYVFNQLRFFKNKQLLLDKVSDGQL